MDEQNQIRPLTARHRIGYALGDFGGCMTFGLMAAFTTRYYINVAMIDTAVIAAMTLVWKLFDALANPFVGVGGMPTWWSRIMAWFQSNRHRE